jgi:endonuclease/exonuclease/phosphatase (EEP) superfamily protein YafD
LSDPPNLLTGAPAHTGGRDRSPRQLTHPITLIGWVIAGGLAAIALLRIFAWDSVEPLAIINALTAVIYLPAWVVVPVALIGRRYALGGLALLVVVAQIVFLLPELTATEGLPRWAVTAPSIRLFDANVYNANPSMAGYAGEIKSFAPQLLTMEEAVPSDVSMLAHAGVLAHLPYRIQVKRQDPKAFLVASEYPLSGDNIVYYDGLPLMVQTTVHLPSGPLHLWVVHTSAPIPGSFAQWKGALDDVAALVASHGTTSLLVVGDFNATWGNKGFRSILDTGLVDAAAARGHAFDFTWSQKLRPLPPLSRIDHVLTGPDVAVTKIFTGDGPGSDHRDIMASVAVRRQSS